MDEPIELTVADDAPVDPELSAEGAQRAGAPEDEVHGNEPEHGGDETAGGPEAAAADDAAPGDAAEPPPPLPPLIPQSPVAPLAASETTRKRGRDESSAAAALAGLFPGGGCS